MHPIMLLVGLATLILVIFLITNVLYPALNKEVEYFWFFKKDWFERASEIKKKEEKKRKRQEKKKNDKS